MPQNDDGHFSHITVTPDDDADVIIEAGIRESHSPTSVDDDESYGAGVHQDSEEPEGSGKSQDEGSGKSQDEGSGRSKDGGSDYHETTLADIEGSKMSTMQRVIVVAAIIVIVVFVIYFVTRP